MIELKNFQQNLVDKLLRFTAPEYEVDEMVIKSPTGSGKTITLLEWMNTYIASTHDNVAFVWFTPGAGELEEQSQDKAKNFSSIKEQSLADALLQGFGKDTATFINYESVVGKNKNAMLTEREKILKIRLKKLLNRDVILFLLLTKRIEMILIKQEILFHVLKLLKQ